MFSWLKYLSSFISRRVRKQNMEWSKGVIFLMATFCPEGLWSAELVQGQKSDQGLELFTILTIQRHMHPHPPHPGCHTGRTH